MCPDTVRVFSESLGVQWQLHYSGVSSLITLPSKSTGTRVRRTPTPPPQTTTKRLRLFSLFALFTGNLLTSKPSGNPRSLTSTESRILSGRLLRKEQIRRICCTLRKQRGLLGSKQLVEWGEKVRGLHSLMKQFQSPWQRCCASRVQVPLD